MVGMECDVLESIQETNKNQWNNLVRQSQQGSLFHTYDWLALLEKELDVFPKHVIVERDGNPLGVFPNFVSKIPKAPFSRVESIPLGSGGPVIGNDESTVLSHMLDATESICSDRIISHKLIIQDLHLIRYGQLFEKSGYQSKLTHCRFVIDLTNSWDSIKSAMSSDRRYNLNKALEQDYSVSERLFSGKRLTEFHKIYRDAMNRVGGHVYPLSFFDQLGNSLEGSIKLIEASVNGTVVGYHLYLLDDDTIHHLFSGVDESDFKYYPSELIHHHTLKWGMDEGFAKYDLGSTPASSDNGMFKYKSQYGGTIVPNLIWEKPYSKIAWATFTLGKRVYNHINFRSIIL